MPLKLPVLLTDAATSQLNIRCRGISPSVENLLFTSSAIQSVWRFPPVNNLRLFLHRLLQTLDTSCVVTADSRSVVSSLVSVPLFSFQKSELSASTSHLISPKMKVSPKPQKVQAQQVERILFSSPVPLQAHITSYPQYIELAQNILELKPGDISAVMASAMIILCVDKESLSNKCLWKNLTKL